MLLSRAFGTENELLKALDKSTGLHLSSLQIALGDMDENKPMVAVTNYIISLPDLKRLKKWLADKYKEVGEHVRNTLEGIRVKVLIEYGCCSRTNNAFLGPSYATLKLRVG